MHHVIMCFTAMTYSNICNYFVICDDVENIQIDIIITTRCKLKVVQDVYGVLDTNYKNKLRKCFFRSLLRLRDIRLALQVVHQLLLQKMKTTKQEEIWFKNGDERARLGLEEFVLVIGLNVGDCNNMHKTLGTKCQIMKDYFKKSEGKIMRRDAYNAFLSCKKRKRQV